MDDDAGLTRDRFLDGRLTLWQPERGYRAGVDPVLLAAAIPAQSGHAVLDLGCGAGAASLCLAMRVRGVDLTGVERQANYAALARRNAQANDIPMTVIEADLTDLPPDLRQRRFDHVIANPPYFDRTRGTPASDHGREGALGIETPLDQWVALGSRRLIPRGRMTMIHRIEGLPALLSAFTAYLGSVTLTPLLPRADRPAKLMLISGIKEGRDDFALAPGIVLHDGAGYTPAIAAVLRNAAALP